MNQKSERWCQDYQQRQSVIIKSGQNQRIKLFTTQSRLITTLKKKTFVTAFSPFPMVFSTLLTLYQTPNFRLVQTESICRQQIKCNYNLKICFGKGRKHCEKRRKCWLPGFSSFPTMFSKAFVLMVIQSGLCVKELKREIIILATFNLSSVNGFNLVMSKILLYGNG